MKLWRNGMHYALDLLFLVLDYAQRDAYSIIYSMSVPVGLSTQTQWLIISVSI
jgi:hypothetical protein